MAVKTPQDMSNEELLKYENIYKTSVILTTVSCTLILAIGIYLLIAKGGKINVFLFLPIVFAGTGITTYSSLKGVRKEKTLRNI
ncbi:hypothetical protein [Pedobacter sp. MC2016-24]|uniref:hypothetical protein n=1 Tax=Pedobacter sp. MC2016-24 TaxID=2780090 RepID=UPI001882139F|nr:hypothetical protein [Pedobacter sp. MC2016-24]MBE9602359.1 hypothetical protein [Pedobacter sp. MC2016-24]